MKAFFKQLFLGILFLSCVFGIYNLSGVFAVDGGIVSESKPKLSIVMPVYNVAPYLDEALNSAEKQTYKNLEIICVNDGSTDNSLSILKNHGKKDKRIKIIDQKNQGVSEARNVGLRAAVGEYIYFFDSDDIMAPHAMEKSIKLLEKYNADVVKFKTSRFKYNVKIDTSKCSYDSSLIKVDDFKPGNNNVKFFVDGGWEVWNQVFRKSSILDNAIEFDKDIGYGEDLVFSFLMSSCVKKVVKDNNVGYFHRSRRPGSIMNSGFKSIVQALSAHLKIVRALVVNKEKIASSNDYLFKFIIYYLDKFMNNVKSKSERHLCASLIYEEIGKNFVEKYKIKLNQANKKRLNNVRRLSKIKN